MERRFLSVAGSSHCRHSAGDTGIMSPTPPPPLRGGGRDRGVYTRATRGEGGGADGGGCAGPWPGDVWAPASASAATRGRSPRLLISSAAGGRCPPPPPPQPAPPPPLWGRRPRSADTPQHDPIFVPIATPRVVWPGAPPARDALEAPRPPSPPRRPAYAQPLSP